MADEGLPITDGDDATAATPLMADNDHNPAAGETKADSASSPTSSPSAASPDDDPHAISGAAPWVPSTGALFGIIIFAFLTRGAHPLIAGLTKGDKGGKHEIAYSLAWLLVMNSYVTLEGFMAHTPPRAQPQPPPVCGFRHHAPAPTFPRWQRRPIDPLSTPPSLKGCCGLLGRLSTASWAASPR
jgi:hypothetical protein